MIKHTTHLLAKAFLVTAVASTSLAAQAQAAPPPSRGELLYTTHCVTCHTTQMHWRAEKKAVDWDSLKSQVRRWQGNAGLQWNDSDIADVARHLNETIYHYPQTADRLSLAAPLPR